jgi:hypothetical protein
LSSIKPKQAATPGVTPDTYFIGSKKESKMKVTTPKLIRWAGLSAMVAGIIFTAIQAVHPPINTSTFFIITSFKTAISIFGLLGITGLYARQVEETGWQGLAGYLLLTIYYAVQMCISFIEPTVLPLLTAVAPTFVESMYCSCQVGLVPNQPWQPRNNLFASIDTLCTWLPAIWHGYVPRSHPAARGGCLTCRIRSFGGHHVCPASLSARPVDIDTDRGCYGLAGIRPLFRTTRRTV